MFDTNKENYIHKCFLIYNIKPISQRADFAHLIINKCDVWVLLIVEFRSVC